MLGVSNLVPMSSQITQVVQLEKGRRAHRDAGSLEARKTVQKGGWPQVRGVGGHVGVRGILAWVDFGVWETRGFGRIKRLGQTAWLRRVS